MNIVRDRIIKLLGEKGVEEDNQYLRYQGLDIELIVEDRKIILNVFDTTIGEHNDYQYKLDTAKIFGKEYMDMKIGQIISDLNIFKMLVQERR